MAVPEDAGVIAACDGFSADGRVAVISVGFVGVSRSAVPPRSGERRWRVAAGCSASSATVLDGWRWRPEWSNRTSGGKVVDADRKSRTSETVFDGLTFSGIAVKSGGLAIWTGSGLSRKHAHSCRR